MWHAETHGDGVMDIPDIRYVRNGGVALAYQVLGDGPMDLVYVQGFINNIDIAWDNPYYARFLRRLSSFSRLIIMDRRGTGLSDRMSPKDLPPLEVLMDDLGVVLDEVGSERTALFGAGDSGCLCAMFAATYPDRVAALALFGVSAAGTATADRGNGANEIGRSTSPSSWPDGERWRMRGRLFHDGNPHLRVTSACSPGGRGSCDKLPALLPLKRSNGSGI